MIYNQIVTWTAFAILAMFVYEEDVDNADWLRTKVQPAKGGFSCTHAHRTGLRSYCYATGQLNALVHLQKNNATIGQWQ